MVLFYHLYWQEIFVAFLINIKNDSQKINLTLCLTARLFISKITY